MARWHSPALTAVADWRTYLERAHGTALALWTRGGDPWSKRQGGGQGTAMWGVMVGSVFDLLLSDLRREGWDAQADALQRSVEQRMRVWLAMPFPYGSEFSWDSTGHEEIATWMARFGYTAQAEQTADAVSAYVSLSPSWAHCGSARRWWDFTINGEGERGNERTFHHYAAALNGVPLFDAAVRSPADDWLWRLAGCAAGGSLTNIRDDGSASMGWHGDPDRLRRDRYSADFGVGLYGHWKTAGSYLSCGALGWLCIACDAVPSPPEAAAAADASACAAASHVRITPRDAYGRRIFLQPLEALLLSVDGGRFGTAQLELGQAQRSVTLRVAPSPAGSQRALLTLRLGGAGATLGARVRIDCAPPCAVGPGPFAAEAAGEEVWAVYFGSAEAVLLKIAVTAIVQ